MIANKDNAVYISNTVQQAVGDTDWIEANDTTVSYTPPQITLDSQTSLTALVTPNLTIATNDPIKVYNSTDGIVTGNLGNVTDTTVPVSMTVTQFNARLYNRASSSFVGGSSTTTTLPDYPDGPWEFGEEETTYTVNGSSVTNTLIPDGITNIKFSLQFKNTGSGSATPAFIRFYYDDIIAGTSTEKFNVYGTGGNSNSPYFNNNDLNTYEIDRVNDVVKYNDIASGISGPINRVLIYGGYNTGSITLTYISGLIGDSAKSANIIGLNLTELPTKAFINKTPTVSICLEEDSDKVLLADEDLTKVSSTTTQFVGTNSRSGLLEIGDNVLLDSTTTVELTNVVEVVSGSDFQYTCTFASQSTAPTTLTIEDRSQVLTVNTETFDNANDEFDITFNDVVKRARAVAYKIEGDNNLEVLEPLQTQFKKDGRA